MKLNRTVVAAFRNIGDAASPPQLFEGTAAESVLWIVERIKENTIAKRFTINIARNKAEALSGLDGAQKIDDSSLRLQALLADVLSDDDSIDHDELAERGHVSVAAPANLKDDYIP